MPNFTKRAIIDSFVKLLNERPLSKITVKDIVEDCGINRNSFYYHFQDIPDLLNEVTIEQTNKICTFSEGETLAEGIETMLKYVVENKRAIYHIWSSVNKASYELQLMKMCEYITRRYVTFFQYEAAICPEDEELIICFMKCSLFGQLTDWLCQKMSYDIVARSRRLCRIFEGCLDVAVQNSIQTSRT